jgi:V8-like Glu-specific endopeptidase
MRFVASLGLSLMIVIILAGSSLAQISLGGSPVSFKRQLQADIPAVYQPAIDVASLLVQDSIEEEEGLPFRFGYPFDVHYTTDNSGRWEVLDDGSRVWRLKIVADGAYTINLLYSRYRLPKGAELYVYSEDRAFVLGAFTERNNKEHGQFATSPTKGDVTIVEYYEPAHAVGQGELVISRVVHGYKDIFSLFAEENGRGYGGSGSCNNNINCPEGDRWRLEQRAVAMVLLSSGTRWCTGAMINNIRQDQTPYFLTANHCLGSEPSWIFMFRYESPGCSNQNGPTYYTLQGCTKRANYSGSDFALLELSEPPPDSFNISFVGWDRQNTPSTSSTAIHHPSGDIKKISFDYNAVTSANYLSTSGTTHWRVGNWEDGTTEGGSSGSPLFDQNHRVVGQLHGGYASCYSITADWYGKFSTSWNGGGNAVNRLRDWLDPDATGALQLDAFDPYAEGVEIAHTPLADTRDTVNNYSVLCAITSDYNLLADSLLLYYRVASTWHDVTLIFTGIVDTYAGYIPTQSPGTDIEYYLEAQDDGGNEYTTDVYSFHIIEYDMDLDPATETAGAAAGDTAWYELTVSNTGNYADEYALSTAISDWWAHFYSTEDTTPISSSGNLAPDDSFTFLVGVPIPASDYGDLDSVTVAASSTNDLTLARSTVLFSQSLGPLGGFPWTDEFNTPAHDGLQWVENIGTDITDEASNAPSEIYSLKLNDIADTIVSQPIDLLTKTDVWLTYAYQRGGTLAAPGADDYLSIDYLNSDDQWVNLSQHAGDDKAMTTFDLAVVGLPSDALHKYFQLRLRSDGDCAGCDNWFVDDIRIDHAAEIATAPTAVIDTINGDDSTEVALIIDNNGSGGLHYIVSLSDTSSWLAVSNRAGQLAPATADTNSLWMFSAALDSGLHSTIVQVNSNDPDDALIEIPISLFVVIVPEIACGDVDNDGVGPDIVDLIYLVMFMFQGGPPPPDFNAVDVNGDSVGPDIVDLIYLVTFMFQGGPDLQCP